ncbi:hypothetical protein [Succinivibrio faecicola]|uniref:Phage protein n=1 Tax=Succinivibrio faecicola TaxID=2820300 RepID=A0ABS7DIA1_9GAMM|nr:hypothetical protein [Succinivibrio faecicola]MBW7571018.1 hypothetical protein [Succinivibrio faecicola]
MITIFELKFQSSESLRKALGIFGSKWSEKLDIKDLLRMAFPESTDTEIKANLKHFVEHGTFKLRPVVPKAIYDNYCHEFGYSLPYDVNGYVVDEEPNNEPKVTQKVTHEPKVTKAKVEVMNQQNDEYNQIKQMLLNEIALIQDAKNYTNEDGEVDLQKADMLFKRAEAVNNIAGSLNDMRRTEIETKKLQLDAVRTALSHGGNKPHLITK